MTDDLSTLADGQLYAALARYQQAIAEGEAIPRPSAFGLAISHYQNEQGIGCLLLHESGATLDSGCVEAPTVLEAAQRAAALVLGTVGAVSLPAASVSAQADVGVGPVVHFQKAMSVAEKAAAVVAAVAAQSELQPDPEPEIDVEGILSRMDAMHQQDPDALKALVKSYKDQFNIGRTPFPKSITTPERAQFLLDALGE